MSLSLQIFDRVFIIILKLHICKHAYGASSGVVDPSQEIRLGTCLVPTHYFSKLVWYISITKMNVWDTLLVKCHRPNSPST